MLPFDVGFVQTDLWGGDRSATVARNARGRDLVLRQQINVLRRAIQRDFHLGQLTDLYWEASACPYRKSNPLAVDPELGDAAVRCWICAN
jgi:hypothetical protein